MTVIISLLLAAIVVLAYVVLVYILVRSRFAYYTTMENIDEYITWCNEQQERILGQRSVVAVVSTRTGLAVNPSASYSTLPAYSECYYSYNEMVFKFWYTWDKNKFIKKPYRLQ